VKGRILITCPLVLLDENNPRNKFSDKNLTGLLMALVPTIWAVLQENTSGGQSGKNKREFQRRKQVTPQAIYVNCILYN